MLDGEIFSWELTFAFCAAVLAEDPHWRQS